MRSRRRRSGGRLITVFFWAAQELLGFTLPLINYHSVKRKLRNLVTLGAGGPSTDAAARRLEPVMTLLTRCAYCGERPTLPHHMHCSHVFCYYCLQGNVLADASFQCPECDRRCVVVAAAGAAPQQQMVAVAVV